jgi:hypothetical protein
VLESLLRVAVRPAALAGTVLLTAVVAQWSSTCQACDLGSIPGIRSKGHSTTSYTPASGGPKTLRVWWSWPRVWPA